MGVKPNKVPEVNDSLIYKPEALFCGLFSVFFLSLEEYKMFLLSLNKTIKLFPMLSYMITVCACVHMNMLMCALMCAHEEDRIIDIFPDAPHLTL